MKKGCKHQVNGSMEWPYPYLCGHPLAQNKDGYCWYWQNLENCSLKKKKG